MRVAQLRAPSPTCGFCGVQGEGKFVATQKRVRCGHIPLGYRIRSMYNDGQSTKTSTKCCRLSGCCVVISDPEMR
eukprot:3715801-Prymnesium_polylepis.1